MTDKWQLLARLDALIAKKEAGNEESSDFEKFNHIIEKGLGLTPAQVWAEITRLQKESVVMTTDKKRPTKRNKRGHNYTVWTKELPGMPKGLRLRFRQQPIIGGLRAPLVSHA